MWPRELIYHFDKYHVVILPITFRKLYQRGGERKTCVPFCVFEKSRNGHENDGVVTVTSPTSFQARRAFTISAKSGTTEAERDPFATGVILAPLHSSQRTTTRSI